MFARLRSEALVHRRNPNGKQQVGANFNASTCARSG